MRLFEISLLDEQKIMPTLVRKPVDVQEESVSESQPLEPAEAISEDEIDEKDLVVKNT